MQTPLAEADHYSHISQCNNVGPWWWKATPKFLDHYLHHDLGMLALLWCLLAHVLILEYPDHHQNLIGSTLYYSGPHHKISSQSIHNCLSNVVHRHTNKQTDRETNATKYITSFSKEVTVYWAGSKSSHVHMSLYCSKVIRDNSEHQEKLKCWDSSPQTLLGRSPNGWKCAEKCRHLQIPRQLHKLCSQPWWWGSVPQLTSKPGIWAPPHPSMAWAGHLDQDQAERVPSCCATVSPVRLRDLHLLQAAYQETGPVPPALPLQSSPCQLEGTCAKPGDPSLGWAHWHWSHVEPGSASLVRTCHSHGRRQTPKTTVPCWALNW